MVIEYYGITMVPCPIIYNKHSILIMLRLTESMILYLRRGLPKAISYNILQNQKLKHSLKYDHEQLAEPAAHCPVMTQVQSGLLRLYCAPLCWSNTRRFTGELFVERSLFLSFQRLTAST